MGLIDFVGGEDGAGLGEGFYLGYFLSLPHNIIRERKEFYQ